MDSSIAAGAPLQEGFGYETHYHQPWELAMSFSAYGTMPAPAPLRWPSPIPGANLDYSLDVSNDLLPIGDSVASAVLSIQPSGTGELQPVDLAVNGLLITAQLSGGIAGRNYVVRIIVNTESGRVFPYLIGLQMNALLAFWPLQPAPTPGFGTAITWSGGVTVFGPSIAAVAAGLVGTSPSLPLLAGTNIIASVPSGASFILPSTIVSGTIVVQDDDATNNAPVYPPPGAQINAMGVGVPFIVGSAGGRISFSTQSPSTQWYAG